MILYKFNIYSIAYIFTDLSKSGDEYIEYINTTTSACLGGICVAYRLIIGVDCLT